MGRPFILNIKFRFALQPLLDSKNDREPHKELKLVETRGLHVELAPWLTFVARRESKPFYFTNGCSESNHIPLPRLVSYSHSLQPLPWNHFLTRPNSRSVENPNRSDSKIRLLFRLVILYSLF